jgi:hypothetical protein
MKPQPFQYNKNYCIYDNFYKDVLEGYEVPMSATCDVIQDGIPY